VPFVAHLYLDLAAEIARRDFQGPAGLRSGRWFSWLRPVGSVEAVAEEVQQHPG